jgi:hypothetical protein
LSGPSVLDLQFGAVVDSGFYHLFEAEQCAGLVDEVGSVIRPSGRYYLLEFATEFPLANTPRQVTADELRGHFKREKGWRIQSRIAPVPAIAACVERV